MLEYFNKQIHDNMIIRLIVSIILTNQRKNMPIDINIAYSLKFR